VNEADAADIVEYPSPLPFDATVECLTKAITRAGMTLFATIDHAAGAREVGMAMPSATVLIYGNPKGGTPVMLGAPLAALDLPLRVLIRSREDGSVAIAFHPVAAMLVRSGVPTELARGLAPAQELLLTAIAS
jgi:uncharacterized protein (DUF302 family)